MEISFKKIFWKWDFVWKDDLRIQWYSVSKKRWNQLVLGLVLVLSQDTKVSIVSWCMLSSSTSKLLRCKRTFLDTLVTFSRPGFPWKQTCFAKILSPFFSMVKRFGSMHEWRFFSTKHHFEDIHVYLNKLENYVPFCGTSVTIDIFSSLSRMLDILLLKLIPV